MDLLKEYEKTYNGGPHIEILDWDKECIKDSLTHKAIPMRQKAFSKDKRKNKYGIHSPLFSTDWEDENAFAERYSCECKELIGRVYEDEICPKCNKPVIFRDVDLSIFGWIKIEGYKIIQPIFYKMLCSAIGEAAFKEIIEFNTQRDENGNIIEIERTSKSPFKNIGLIEFQERFDEIMLYYRKKKPNKQNLIDEIMRNKKKVFTSSIPVFSSVLRPTKFKNESKFFGSIDRKYEPIIKLALQISEHGGKKKRKNKNGVPLSMQSKLIKIQDRIMSLWVQIFELIDQKDGHIRGEILGGRLNWSSRNVIIPDPTLKADEIKIGYLAFLELYRNEIIALLTKMSDITENDAYDQWYRATINFNKKIYQIMRYIVEKWKPMILINRNPTINYGSILCMTIVEVKDEYNEDYTMSLPIQILGTMNADFDGDILNILSLKTKAMKREFDAKFNPRKNMFISRTDGLFNDDFNLMKDQIIGLYQFCNI